MAAHRIVGLVAVAALAGCGSVESPPAPAGGQAVASTPVPAPAPGWSSAPGTGVKLYVNVGHDGDGRVVTRVAIADRDGGTRSIRLVRGLISVLGAGIPEMPENPFPGISGIPATQSIEEREGFTSHRRAGRPGPSAFAVISRSHPTRTSASMSICTDFDVLYWIPPPG